MKITIPTILELTDTPTFTIIDIPSKKTVFASVDGTNFRFQVWGPADYDIIGDYTQAAFNDAASKHLSTLASA